MCNCKHELNPMRMEIFIFWHEFWLHEFHTVPNICSTTLTMKQSPADNITLIIRLKVTFHCENKDQQHQAHFILIVIVLLTKIYSKHATHKIKCNVCTLYLDTKKTSPKPSSRNVTVSSTQCAICLNDLDERVISALGQKWHTDCFRCSVCDDQLTHWYFEKEGLLFCRDDYLQRFGDICQQCMALISGPAMIVEEHKFHPECFRCEHCRQYIGDGDSYALVERSKLFW